jgi:hypothetical protein
MPWHFRKSFRFGGARMTVSKSGVSYSLGGKGVRVTTGPSGTYVSVGSHGVRYRQRIAGPQVPTAPPPVCPAPGAGAAPAAETAIPTAKAQDLVDESSAATLDAINRQLAAPIYAWAFWIFGTIAALALCLASVWLCLLVLLATWCFGYLAEQADATRRSYTLWFDIRDYGADRWRDLNDALGWLTRNHRIWRVDAAALTSDWKYHGGASRLVNRRRATLYPECPPQINSNVVPYCLDVGLQKLYFFPDRIYVLQAGRFGAVDYASLTFDTGTSQFIEDEGATPDAQVVDHTWLYVNRDGGPDRRFSYNRQIPVCLYPGLVLRSSGGLNILLLMTSIPAVRTAAGLLSRALGSTPPLSRSAAAWDCGCGTRNAASFQRCRNCGLPLNQCPPDASPRPTGRGAQSQVQARTGTPTAAIVMGVCYATVVLAVLASQLGGPQTASSAGGAAAEAAFGRHEGENDGYAGSTGEASNVAPGYQSRGIAPTPSPRRSPQGSEPLTVETPRVRGSTRGRMPRLETGTPLPCGDPTKNWEVHGSELVALCEEGHPWSWSQKSGWKAGTKYGGVFAQKAARGTRARSEVAAEPADDALPPRHPFGGGLGYAEERPAPPASGRARAPFGVGGRGQPRGFGGGFGGR